jgi:K+-transporting ATPase ATPase B chain
MMIMMSKNNNVQKKERGKKESAIKSGRVILGSFTKMSPYYLARNSPVMFAVEVGFLLVLAIAVFPDMSREYVNQSRTFYIEIAVILVLTVWFATFSESLSEAQARARVYSLRSLEKEVPARKLVNGKEAIVTSTSLKPGDEVVVHAGEVIPRDGLVNEGKAFVDESMMTGESNPVFKEKGDRVIGGTRVASDKLLVEITAEMGRSFLDQMVGLIESATRPKTKNEIALAILLAGLSIIFIMVIGTLLFFARFLGYPVDIATLVALLVALMPTTIGALLPAIGVAGITRLGRDNIIAKSGKGIEAAGDCDVLVLDKTGTITEGSRSAVAFMPMQGFTEEDIGQAAFAASIHDTTHEGKSTVDLAEAKNFVPPLLEKIITARPIEFSAETRYSGIELIPSKRATLEEMEAVKSFNGPVSNNSSCKVAAMLREITRSNSNARILKGSIDAMLPMADNLNEAELKWKSQEVSKTGGTPLIVIIDRTAIGLVALKDNLKENIRQKLDEVRATGISTVMITEDNKLTAEVIAREADVDQVIAEAKPTDKLRKVEEEQGRGHVIGMVGDGTNDAPALAKADVGLAMNSGTAAAKEAANMVDLDSDPSKILKVVKLGKQLLMTRGAITTFSIANDVAKYFALLPAMFMESNPKMQALNIMQLHSDETAVLSTLIFNAIIIPLLIPLALKGTRFKPEPPQKTFVRNMFIYGMGGAILPFAAIEGIDILLSMFMK